MYKYFVTNDGSHDLRSTDPEPVLSRTRRKLLLAKKNGEQITTTAEVCHEMEFSSEEENVQAVAAAEKSERVIRDCCLSGVGGDRVGGATAAHAHIITTCFWCSTEIMSSNHVSLATL